MRILPFVIVGFSFCRSSYVVQIQLPPPMNSLPTEVTDYWLRWVLSVAEMCDQHRQLRVKVDFEQEDRPAEVNDLLGWQQYSSKMVGFAGFVG